LVDVPLPGLRDEPIARASNATFLNHMMDAGWAIRSRPALSADSDPAVRFRCVVLVELRGNLQGLR
jgi:hypothetical protein